MIPIHQGGTRPVLRCQGKVLLSMPSPERISHLQYAVLPRDRSVRISRSAFSHLSASGIGTMSTIRAIHPYGYEGLRVFDDDAVELRQEPFISGADGILDRLASVREGARRIREIRQRLKANDVWTL